jgi:hypothetical protein
MRDKKKAGYEINGRIMVQDIYTFNAVASTGLS